MNETFKEAKELLAKLKTLYSADESTLDQNAIELIDEVLQNAKDDEAYRARQSKLARINNV